MKILVLCNAFEHPNYNARLQYQCEYLSKHGHELEVYTVPQDAISFPHKYPIHEIGEQWENNTFHKERKFAYQVMWQSRRFKFDLVFCSTNGYFPLGAAASIAKAKNVPLFVDLTEVAELTPMYRSHPWWDPVNAIKQRIYTKRRNEVLQQARGITTLSEEYVAFIKPINPCVSLIYNGFDPKKFYFDKTKTDLFRINYIGYAYESQNVNMALNAMDRLRKEMPKAQWNFYSEELEYNDTKYSQPNLRGLLPLEIIGDTARQSSIILLFHDSEDNGLNTEQFYQAVGCEKPVVFSPAAEGPIPELIAKTNLGISTRSVKECMAFIQDYYQQWEKDGYTHRDVQNKDLFNAEKQTEQLEQLLMQVVDE